MADVDPETLNINQLKSALGAAGVQLPAASQKKNVYVDLYKKHISSGKKDPLVGDSKEKKRARDADDGDEEDDKRGKKRKEGDKDEIETVPDVDNGLLKETTTTTKPTTESRTTATATAQSRSRFMDTATPTDAKSPAPKYYTSPAVLSPIPSNMAGTPRSDIMSPARQPSEYSMTSSFRRTASSAASSTIPKSQHILLQLISAIFVLGFVAIFYTTALKGPTGQAPLAGLPYCDTEFFGATVSQDKDCQSCPLHGWCEDGKLVECEPEYIIKGSICVLDKELEQTAMQMVQAMQYTLEGQAGRAECSAASTKYVYEQDLRTALQDSHIADPENFETVYKRAMELVTAAPQLKIGYEYDEERGRRYYSDAPRYPWACRLGMFYDENTLGVWIAVVAVLAIAYANHLYKKNAREASLVSELKYTALEIIYNGGSVSKHDIKARLSDDYSSSTVDSVWKKLENSIKEDSRIAEGENDSHDAVWEWKGPS